MASRQKIIRLIPEVPESLVIASPEATEVGDQMMFSMVDNKTLFLPRAAGRQVQERLRELGVQCGDRVLIREGISYSTGEPRIQMEVYKVKAGSKYRPEVKADA